MKQQDGLITKMAVEDGKVHFGYEQDVAGAIDFAARIRSERTVDTINSEHTLNHVAFVPNSIILKMRFEDGVNFYDDSQSAKVMQLLQTKYSKFKTTEKRIA